MYIVHTSPQGSSAVLTNHFQLCKSWNPHFDDDLRKTIFGFVIQVHIQHCIKVEEMHVTQSLSTFVFVFLTAVQQLPMGVYFKYMMQDTDRNQLDMLVLRFCIIQTKPKRLVVCRHISLYVKFLVYRMELYIKK